MKVCVCVCEVPSERAPQGGSGAGGDERGRRPQTHVRKLCEPKTLQQPIKREWTHRTANHFHSTFHPPTWAQPARRGSIFHNVLTQKINKQINTNKHFVLVQLAYYPLTWHNLRTHPLDRFNPNTVTLVLHPHSQPQQKKRVSVSLTGLGKLHWCISP